MSDTPIKSDLTRIDDLSDEEIDYSDISELDDSFFQKPTAAWPPEPDDIGALYRRAFTEFGTQALWNMRPVENPTPGAALAITKALRIHGGMDGRRLAERIEELCGAAH